MTDTMLALLLTVGLLAVLAVWVPLLHGLERLFRRESRRFVPERSSQSEDGVVVRYNANRVA